MKSYRGAVLFVDMLGFGALTEGKLSLGAEECKPWSVEQSGEFVNQLLAAQILLTFRRALLRAKNAFGTVKIAQLSDCAFVWSNDIGAVADAGRHLMHDAVSFGLLCRGGLAVGEIHEPNKVNHALGAYVVGNAVTRAVGFERMGKGTRIFTDQETALHILEARPKETFQPLIDPLTGNAVDEWMWYMPVESLQDEQDLDVLRQVVERLVRSHTMLRYSPKLSWSATTLEGRRQIACSIVAVSDAMVKISGREEYRFSVEHLLQPGPGRSVRIRKRIAEQFREEILAALKDK